MGFDAMANDTSALPAEAARGEIGKKKRANRSAKLKQCKLDARREQWLSQVKNKGYKDMASSPTSHPQDILEGRSAERERRRKAAAASLEHDTSSLQDGSDAESLTLHPSSTPSRKECPTSNSISSSGSSIGSCSRSVSDAEEEEEEDETGEKGGGGGLDDWEAVADALSVSPDNVHQDHRPKSADALTSNASLSTTVIMRSSEPIKREPDRTVPRAWRPDDVFRPQSLPNLSKQRSFPMNIERRYDEHHNHRGLFSPLPSPCPICYEDLDLTDSSFLPCTCGFRLCLFCHKKILEADGRCPGCRKQYSPMTDSEEIGIVTGVGVPTLSYRLSRSCSMSSRS